MTQMGPFGLWRFGSLLAQCCITSGGTQRGEGAPALTSSRARTFATCSRPCRSRAASVLRLLALALDELDLEPAQVDEFHRALDELHVEVIAAVAAA